MLTGDLAGVITPKIARRKLGVAVCWQPVDDAYFCVAELLSTSRWALPIYVTQPVLIDVEAHCGGSTAPFAYGLLTGELCTEPKTGRRYMLIEGATHAPPHSIPADAVTQIQSALESLAADAARHRKLPVGWYLGGTAVGPAKSGSGLAFHRSLFTEPWQVLLTLEEGENTRGTFVRVEPQDGRAYSAPFFELVTVRARAPGGLRATVVNWENYRTPDSVFRLPRPRSRRTDTSESLTSLRGMLVAASEHPVAQASHPRLAAADTGAKRSTPSASTPPASARAGAAASGSRITPRPAITFPMLVPPQSPWAAPRARRALLWTAASIIAGVLITIAFLLHRIA